MRDATRSFDVVTPKALPIPPDLTGLSEREAARLLSDVGPNRWVARDRLAWLREALRLLLDPMAVMLAIAAVIYVVLGEKRDAIVLAMAMIPVLGVDVLLEARSRAALAEVVRDAHVLAIPIEDGVPGDLLVLREGHTVAADGATLWAANLANDESSLTGESEPQSKEVAAEISPARPDAQFFAGSVVVSGHGFGRVMTAGAATRYGGIAALVAETEPSASPLQRQAGSLVRRLGGIAILVAVALVPLSLARGDSWAESLLGAVSLAMAAIPEEFPIVLTLFLSVGAWRLSSRGMLVRRLTSVDTLGSTTVICTDKTGTLTRGEFHVTEHLVLDPTLSEQRFLEAAILACERHPVDGMERAINAYAERNGVSHLWSARRMRWSGTTSSMRLASTCRMCGSRFPGFQDPLRAEVPAAIEECQQAGIRVKMITGDHPLTAHAIAESAGILPDDSLIVTGDELARLSDGERKLRIERAAIFARISPEQKFLIVDALKRSGDIVAMTGDGVNDAPALRRADIGIAMGQRGTDVARATADWSSSTTTSRRLSLRSARAVRFSRTSSGRFCT